MTISEHYGLIRAEKDASEVSNSELGATTTDMPKFKTLSLNDSPSALDSADRYVLDSFEAMGWLLSPSHLICFGQLPIHFQGS